MIAYFVLLAALLFILYLRSARRAAYFSGYSNACAAFSEVLKLFKLRLEQEYLELPLKSYDRYQEAMFQREATSVTYVMDNEGGLQ
jgi:hypothetical protein